MPMRAESPTRPAITDAQVHVWADPTPERPWPDLGLEPQRVPALGPDELLARMDAAAFPDLRITVDHLALDGADGPLTKAVAPLLPLAKHANVAVKASALPCFVTEDYPYPQIVRTVYELVAAFGPNRVFWGSDLSRLPCSYEQLIGLFLREMPRLTPEDLNWIMGKGVSAWLNWPRAA